MAAYQLYDTGFTVTKEDKLLSLSICKYSGRISVGTNARKVGNHFQSWNLWIRMKEEKRWNMQDWIRMSLIIKRRIQRMKSNIEMKMELMERRQAVHANKIQALMLMIKAMQIPEKEKNRKILKAVRVSTALLWLLTCVEDVVLMIRKNYN